MIKVEVIGKLTKKPKKCTSGKGILFCIDVATSMDCEEKNVICFTADLSDVDEENAMMFLTKGCQVRIYGDLKFKVNERRSANHQIEKIISKAEIEYLNTKK